MSWSGDLQAAWLTLKLAACATLLLLIVGTPLAWWLATRRSAMRLVIEAIVALPLVLPPTVLGFYLLVAFAPDGPIGHLTDALGLTGLAFSFPGLVIGSVIYSLPFVVQPLQAAFTQLGRAPVEAAATLGAGPLDRFLSVVVPLTRSGFATAATLGFAHTLGEFGIVLMIGGNIPGETRTLSIAIFEHAETLAYDRAHVLSAAMLLASFLVLWAVARVNRNADRRS